MFSHSNVILCAYETEKGQGHSEIPTNSAGNMYEKCSACISLTTPENSQAAKEKQNIPAKSHSAASTDVKKHQACVSELDQQILKQHHLPLDC